MIWTTSTISSTSSRAVDQSRCAVVDVSTCPHLLVDDVVIRFDIQLDTFRVSTSSAIAIRCCRCFASRTQAPHSRIIGSNCASSVPDLQSTNHRLASNVPGFTDSFSNSFDSSSRFVRLENHNEFGYLTPFDLTPDLWRSAFTSTIDRTSGKTHWFHNLSQTWSCFRLSSRRAPRCLFSRSHLSCSSFSSTSPTQSESMCTWKSSCINSMGSSFLGPS